jgi:hypothetical protein
MLDFDLEVDVAIIDEVQMLEDIDRGWAWVNAGSVLRFSWAGAKTLIVDSSSSHEPECIYHVSNRATSGNLTLTAAGGMTLNAPKGGTLVLEPGDTVSLHCISSTVMDVLGSTKSA